MDAEAGTSLMDHEGSDFRRLAEAAPVPALLVGPLGRVIWKNHAAKSIVPNGTLLHALHLDDKPSAGYVLERLIGNDITRWTGEWRFQAPGGPSHWAAVTAVSTMGPDGRRAVLVQAFDIDERRRSAEAVAVREARWNHALESAGQGVWDHDFRTQTVFYSRMWRIMRGISPEEPVQLTMDSWLKRVHPEDRERIRETVLRQDAGEVPYNAFEYRERHADGHYMWILSRGRPVAWFPDGRPARVLGTDTDISALKHVEEKLAAETELLHVTMRSIAEGTIATDAEGVITFVNPIAESMIGRRSADAVGHPAREIMSIIDGTTGKMIDDPITACLRNGAAVFVDGDVQLAAENGHRRDVRCAVSPVKMPGGEVAGAVVLFQDMTESRALHRQLAHTASHDSLTGLPNRAAFEEVLSDALMAGASRAAEHALCFVDLDRFKAVNDSAGHIAGDALLKEIAAVIRSNIRAQDFAARIGGDEFGIVMADAPPAEALRVAAGIVRAIGAMEFNWEGRTYRPGACVGIARLHPDGDTRAAVLRRADEACYAAKASGRNTVVTFEQLETLKQQLRAVS